jgi:hypothetical protein
MIYLLVRKNMENFDPASTEKVSRWNAFANQVRCLFEGTRLLLEILSYLLIR